MTNEEAAQVLENQRWLLASSGAFGVTTILDAITLAITALRTKHSIPAASGDCVMRDDEPREQYVDPFGQQMNENGF